MEGLGLGSKLLKRGYAGDYVAEYLRGKCNWDTRSLDYSSDGHPSRAKGSPCNI